MIPLYAETGTSTCPLGMPMCQNRLAVPFWSFAMEVAPPQRIIELGTYGGGFITALAVHAWNIGARCITFERAPMAPDERFAKLSHFLGIEFRVGDVYSDEVTAEIAGLISAPGRVYLLSDCAKKGVDFNRFAPFLKPGDIIGAHDHYVGHQEWWHSQEIFPEEVAATVAEHGLVPFYQDSFDMAAWLVYQKG